MKYDGFLYGNGLTLNLLYHLKQYMPQDKHYLLNIDDFLKKLIAKQVSQREENKVFIGIYKKDTIETRKFFSLLKEGLNSYYQQFNGNIEYVLGQQLFEKNHTFNFIGIIDMFPALYNIWWIILSEYLSFLRLDDKIDNFYKSVNNVLGNPTNVWTTNYDLFSESLHPKHLHGYFLREIKEYRNVIYKITNDGNQYYFKYIWGHNGQGKANLINQLRQYSNHEQYFDFDFFFDHGKKLDRLLIYGISFQEAGYMESMKNAYPKYQKASIGGIVDEHILVRVKAMLDSGELRHFDITYFSEDEKKRFIEVMEAVKISEYTLVKCQDLIFAS